MLHRLSIVLPELGCHFQVLGYRMGQENGEGMPTVLETQTQECHGTCTHTFHWQELSHVAMKSS